MTQQDENKLHDLLVEYSQTYNNDEVFTFIEAILKRECLKARIGECEHLIAKWGTFAFIVQRITELKAEVSGEAT